MTTEKSPPWRYLLSDIDFDDSESEAVLAVLHSKWLSMGPVTKKFEEDFQRYVDVPHALATANCTAALHMALESLGIGRGDEVIVPSLTFVATSNAVLYTGARPVFAGIHSLGSPLIDPEQIEAKISPATKAIVVMHYAGYPCDMERIMALAGRHGLFVIEDAAHAVGSRCGERMCGTIGDIGCFSFFANKNLPAGEGGMLVTRDRDIYERAVRLRSHGMTSLTWDRARGHSFGYDVVGLGYNYRPTEVGAAIAQVQLRKLPHHNIARNDIFAEYARRLAPDDRILLPFAETSGNEGLARHLLPIVLLAGTDRDAFRAKMAGCGIQTSVHYPPVHTFSFYRSILEPRQAERLETTEAFGNRVVTLPMHPLLTGDDVEEICRCVDVSLAEACR